MRLALALVVLALSTSLASAQPGMTPPIEQTPQPTSYSKQKNPSIAVLLSLGVPLAGIVAIGATKNDTSQMIGLGALYFGPSTGQWYSGKIGGLGLGLRAVGAVSVVYGFAKLVNSPADCDFKDDCSAEQHRANRDGAVGGVLLYGGAAMWIGSSIYDIVLAKRAAETWNREHTISLTPGLVGTTTSRVPGLYVTGRF